MLDIEDFKKKLDKKSRLMGIDPGKKRVGIAISDENKIVATPYTTLIKIDYTKFLSELRLIIKENNIKGIIIGNPINMNGSAGPSSQSAKDLARNLSKDITENITMWDERLSSQGAFNLTTNLNTNTTKKVKNDFISNPPIRSLNPHFAYKTIPVEDKIGFPYLVMSL